MNRFFNKSCNAVAVLASVLLLGAGASASERYRDRMFDVEVTHDWFIAEDVPHLADTNFVTEAMTRFYTGREGTIAYFFDSEDSTVSKSLYVDLYMPKKDETKNRPMVIVSHGGAFVAGHKDDKDQKSVGYCDSLAARGFVTMSLEYRLGVKLESKDCSALSVGGVAIGNIGGLGDLSIMNQKCQLSIDSVNFARTVYRGVQDIRAAVRFARKNGDDLGIDTNRIYLLGNSAGAILSLENVYAASEDDFPAYVNASKPLGKLDAYGHQGVGSKANAVVSLWGAVHNLDMIGDNKTPLLLIHGTSDATVAFKTARPLSNVAKVLENLMPETAALMGSYTLDLHAPTLYGSYVIDSLLTAKNIKHETYFVEGVGHEFYDDDPKYAVEVQKRAFDFFYRLAVAPAGAEGEEYFQGLPARKVVASNGVVMSSKNRSFFLKHGYNVKYEVFDLRGHTIKAGKTSAGMIVDLGALNSGSYILRVQGERPISFKLK